MINKLNSLDEKDRYIFGRIADFLIPEYGRMPSATAVDVNGKVLDHVLSCRPDISEDFFRGIRGVDDESPSEMANKLSKRDAAAFNAISLAASAAYYMAPEVMSLIKYPGQQKIEYDPHETPEYLLNGMIERLIRRGPIYKPTPTK